MTIPSHVPSKPKYSWCIALFLLFFSFSCSVTRDVKEGELLLNNVKVKVDRRVYKSDMNKLVEQQENRKLLWTYRFKLRFFSSILFKKENDSKLRYSIGEPPVIFDSTLVRNSERRMTAYLKNRGFYANKVEHEIKYRKKKVKLTYNVTTGAPTTIASISNKFHVDQLQREAQAENQKTLLKEDNNFDVDVLENERERITRVMRNAGYFYFNKDLIYFHTDTLREKKKAYITVLIKEDPQMFIDTIPVDPYKTYKINKVLVSQSFRDEKGQSTGTDSILDGGYYFINGKRFTVKPKVISRSIFHQHGDFFKLENHESTNRRLFGLNNYDYVNISYRNSTFGNEDNYVDCIIKLSPNRPKSFTVETNGTNTGGNLGINGAVSFLNRNTFRGAEMLRFRIFGGLEAQSVSGADNVPNTPFNTVEFSPEISLTLPRFLLPVDQNRFAKRQVPKTTMIISYNYQQRPDYTRGIINAGLIYSWKESITKTHSIQPINISQVDIRKTKDFQDRLDSLDNSTLTASYDDQFITSVVYGFVFNNQILKKGYGYQIFRANVEAAGNLVYTMDQLFLNRTTNENGQYLVGDIPYAQFFRTYLEFIQNFRTTNTTNLVGRVFAGAGIPYGNSAALPFVRSFFGGGTNGIRAWAARRLGPGSISNEELEEANVDRIGDIKLEGNVEYRFKIYKSFEGAVFSDIGNIWAYDNPEISEAGNFKFEKLWTDLAIAGGAGARLNFEYFVIRFDVAWRAKDPGAEDPKAVKLFYPEPPVYNFAIGYPF